MNEYFNEETLAQAIVFQAISDYVTYGWIVNHENESKYSKQSTFGSMRKNYYESKTFFDGEWFDILCKGTDIRDYIMDRCDRLIALDSRYYIRENGTKCDLIKLGIRMIEDRIHNDIFPRATYLTD